jgi:large subunit ribosomal protein L35e
VGQTRPCRCRLWFFFGRREEAHAPPPPPPKKPPPQPQLKELRQELAALRVAKVTGGAPNKLSKIKGVRKAVARVLTVYRHNVIGSLRKKTADDAASRKGRALLPLDLRPKKTRAIRKALSKEQQQKKTVKAAKKAAAFPRRKYALKA